MYVSTAESDSNFFLLARVLKPPLCAPTCSHADLPRARTVPKLEETAPHRRSAHGTPAPIPRRPAPARHDVGTVTLQHIAGRMIPGSHKIAPRSRAHLALATLVARHPTCHQTCARIDVEKDESHLPPFWPSPHQRRRHYRRRFEARGPPPPPSRRLVARSLCCRHATRSASFGSAGGNASCRAARADAASCRAAPQAEAASCGAAQAVASGGFGIVALTLVSSSVASEALLTRNR